mmetsp:Transcript_19959/g.56092  ORF Transcript_19959/g.56092 Transcript_19959/m.56092 type:complete len:310 (-) Transcript_19959:933-1862(-)
MVEKSAVHGLAEVVHAAERKGQVGDPAVEVALRVALLQRPDRLDEVQAVLVVLLDERSDGEDVGVKDHFVRLEARFVHEQVQGPFADLHLAFLCGRLALLVERHDNHRRTVLSKRAGLAQKLLLALLETDTVRDAASLAVLQALNDDLELGRVHHDGHSCNVRLPRDEAKELAHCGHPVDHGLIYVDVQDLRPVLHLQPRHRHRLLKLPRRNQPREPARARYVAPLTDVTEVEFRGKVQWLHATEPQHLRSGGNRTRRNTIYGLPDGFDVIRSCATAAANHVDEPILGEALHVPSHRRGALVVAAHRVG